MNDELARKIRSRVEYRLTKAPRYATLNALLFSLVAAFLGFFVIGMPYFGFSFFADSGIFYDGSFYLLLFGVIAWAGVTALYALALFVQSGAWGRRREQLIQREILEAMERYDLEEDEWVDLHLKVSQDIERGARPFQRLLTHGLLNGFGWVGGFGLMGFFWFFFASSSFPSLTDNIVALLPVISLLSIALLPIHVIFQKPEQNVEHLRAVYGGKPKRKLAESEPDYSRLIQTGDDGELVYGDLDDDLDGPDEKPKVDHRGI